MNKLLALIILLFPASAIADNQIGNSFASGLAAGMNQRLTGQPASDYLNQLQQQQLIQAQIQYQRQLVEQQRIQNQLRQQELEQRKFDSLNNPGSTRNAPSKSRSKPVMNCTTMGSNGIYNTYCR